MGDPESHCECCLITLLGVGFVGTSDQAEVQGWSCSPFTGAGSRAAALACLTQEHDGPSFSFPKFAHSRGVCAGFPENAESSGAIVLRFLVTSIVSFIFVSDYSTYMIQK